MNFQTTLLTKPASLFVFDFILFNLSYFTSNFIKRDTFKLDPKYIELLFLFYFCWLVSSIIARKFNKDWYSSYQTGLIIITKSALYLGYCIAFMIVILGVPAFSRLQIFMTCAGLFIFEFSIWSIICLRKQRKAADGVTPILAIPSRPTDYSPYLFGADLISVFSAFFIVNYIKRNTFILLPAYDQLLLIILGCWAVAAYVAGKFNTQIKTGFYFALLQWIKAGLFMLAMISVVVYGLRLFQFSRFQAFGTILVLLVFEITLLRIYFLWQRSKHESDIESPEQVRKLLNQEELDLDVNLDHIRKNLLEPIRDKLKARLEPEDPALFDFIDTHIDLNKILCLETTSTINNNYFSLTADRIPVRLILHPEKINNTRRINQHLLDIHKSLLPGGYFIGFAHTISTHKDWIFSRFPKDVAPYIYFLDFCFTRVMPKLPFAKKIYFSVTKGRNRVISKAEILGRLCFCGFEIVAEKNIGKRFYVIARKVKTPAVDASPTYGPLVELKRVGFNNEIMLTYKFRTMHPYSEYLQQYMVDTQGLQKGGKLENDFRLTSWGTLMRKLWIDELPMLYNWAKGDMQLVGVRPLSVQYFSMYDDELKSMRKQVRPGLIPPFYADLPQSLEEIIASEKKYIRSYLAHPLKTQWHYFWKAFANIVLRGARSK